MCTSLHEKFPLVSLIFLKRSLVFPILLFSSISPLFHCMHVKKQQLELDMEQQTGSKSGKEYIKAVYCHPDYLTYMQSTSSEMPG